ncbi:MAG: hypothetical protein AVO39_03765 [delta proteobacterium MLS_D]|jgi:aspartyl-tRNA(Asn)/glutamyl-tRNA(Gln) amidotransferase subunit A|nr:MAG: hypothetical protein AVO39_03765 [delta proteobacterium MLS_D]
MKQSHIIHRGTRSAGDGPLEGKNIALHPSVSVRDWPTEAGTRALEGFIALEDATVVRRLEAAGATLAGTTSMNELGLGIDRDGAGPAVAAREADIALLMDHMGEARIGAARVGLTGYKPSFGVISRFGLIGLIPSMECLGFMAKDPADIRNAAAAACGDDEQDFTLSPTMPDFSNPDQTAEYRLGVVSEALALLDPGDGEAFRTALSELEPAGCVLRDASIAEFDLFPTVHHIIGSVEASSSAGKFDGVRYGHRARGTRDWNEMYLTSRGEAFGPLLKSFLFQGAFYQFEQYDAFEKACRLRARLVASLEKLFDDIDFLVLPTTRGGAAPSVETTTTGDLYNLFRFTLPANLAGLPAVHLSLPGSAPVQVLGRRLDDARLLDLAVRLNRHHGGTAS